MGPFGGRSRTTRIAVVAIDRSTTTQQALTLVRRTAQVGGVDCRRQHQQGCGEAQLAHHGWVGVVAASLSLSLVAAALAWPGLWCGVVAGGEGHLLNGADRPQDKQSACV